jgi:hypothetical protein
MPVPWPPELISEALPLTVITGIAAAIVGVYLGGSLTAAATRGDRSETRMPALAPAIAGLVAIVAAVAMNVGDDTPSGWSANVQLTEVTPNPDRTVDARINIDPPSAAEDAYWLQAISWQGGGLVIDHLDEVSPGAYQTTKPLPVHGTWKTLIRLHRDDTVAGLPIYMPEDTAIPAKEVPAKPSFTRPFVDETQILQREQKDDVPSYLATIAYSVVALIVVALVILLGWVLQRLGTAEPPRPAGGRTRARPKEVPA